MNLSDLKAFFPPEAIDWKPIAVSKKTGKALAAAYLTNRAIMDRLDDVCGPENWRNEFKPGPDGGVLCGLSIRVPLNPKETTHEWLTKWDGAENTDIEPIKGGLSSSMRRAAVQWGIGRYLYDFPSTWEPVDQYGRFAQKPSVPRQFLPTDHVMVKATAPGSQTPTRRAPRPTFTNSTTDRPNPTNPNERPPDPASPEAWREQYKR